MRTRDMSQLAQQAVQAALRGDWDEAKKLNESVLEDSPEDCECLCRLARAYVELGKIKKALTTYKKVLSLDPYNTIAQKAVERLEKLPKNATSVGGSHINGRSLINSASAFLEEPGKTKTATLIHLGATEVLTSLDTGDEVKLIPHAHRVAVATESGDFIGRLPDDLSARIIKLSKAGNEYNSLVRSATPTSVKIFIREVLRGKSIQDIPSFPVTDKSSYVAFTPPDLVHDERPEIESLEESFE